jgi:hypothetical protein
MKLFFIIFGAIVAAGVVLVGVVALPYVYSKKEEAKAQVDDLRQARCDLEARAIIAQAQALDLRARNQPGPDEQKKIVAEVERLKKYQADKAAELGNSDRMNYAGQLIRQIDDWTREWRE